MAAPDQLAKDLKTLEPPASIDRIVRFLKSLAANDGAALNRLTHPAPLVSTHTATFADQIASKSMLPAQTSAMQPFHSMVINYSVRVEELEQFTEWLVRFQHRLPELENRPVPAPSLAFAQTSSDTSTNSESSSRVKRRGQTNPEDNKDADTASESISEDDGGQRSDRRHRAYDDSASANEDKDFEPESRGSAPVRRRIPAPPPHEPLDLKPFLQRSARSLLNLNAVVGSALLGSEMAPAQTYAAGGMTQVVHTQVLAPFIPQGWVRANPVAQAPLFGPQIGAERVPFVSPAAAFPSPSAAPAAMPTSGIDFSTLKSRSGEGISKGIDFSGTPGAPTSSPSFGGAPGAPAFPGQAPSFAGPSPYAPAEPSSFPQGLGSPSPAFPSAASSDSISEGIAGRSGTGLLSPQAPSGSVFPEPEDAKGAFQPPLAGVNESTIATALRANPSLLRSVVEDVGPERMGVALAAPAAPGLPGIVPASPGHGLMPPGGIPATAFPGTSSPRAAFPAVGSAGAPAGRAPEPLGAPRSLTFGSTAQGAPAFAGGSAPQDEEKPEAPAFSPEHAQLTIIAPPLTVASAESAAGGSGVQMDWSSLAATAGTLTPSGLSDIVAALPPGAQAIYPGLPANRMSPGAFSLNLGPSVLGHLLGSAYGPSAAAHAPSISSKAPTKPPASGKIQASLVPLQRPAGNAPGILPTKGDPSGPGALGHAGGSASRTGPMAFLGLPVSVAPSLGASPTLKNEVAVRGAAADLNANRAVSPDKFNLLKSRVMPSIHAVDVEPNKQAWAKAAPSFGLKSADPISILSPQARQPAPSAAGPTPSSTQIPSPQGGRVPMSPSVPNSSTPHASPPIHPPTLGLQPPQPPHSPLPGVGHAFTTSPPAPPSNDPRRLPTHLPPVRHNMPGSQVSPEPPRLPMAPASPVFDTRRPKELSSHPTPPASSTPPRLGIPNRTFVPSRPSISQRPGSMIGTQRGLTTRIQHQPPPRHLAPASPAAPDMLYAAPPSAPPSRFAVQKAREGVSSQSAQSRDGSESSGGSRPDSGVNDAANVDLLASEVWTLLKHRIKIESDRRGRW